MMGWMVVGWIGWLLGGLDGCRVYWMVVRWVGWCRVDWMVVGWTGWLLGGLDGCRGIAVIRTTHHFISNNKLNENSQEILAREKSSLSGTTRT